MYIHTQQLLNRRKGSHYTVEPLYMYNTHFGTSISVPDKEVHFSWDLCSVCYREVICYRECPLMEASLYMHVHVSSYRLQISGGHDNGKMDLDKFISFFRTIPELRGRVRNFFSTCACI